MRTDADLRAKMLVKALSDERDHWKGRAQAAEAELAAARVSHPADFEALSTFAARIREPDFDMDEGVAKAIADSMGDDLEMVQSLQIPSMLDRYMEAARAALTAAARIAGE